MRRWPRLISSSTDTPRFRIKDPKASIKFYEEVLGMEVGYVSSHACCPLADWVSASASRTAPTSPTTCEFISLSSNPADTPSLGYPSGFGDKAGATKAEKGDLFTGREGVLELCHNHGTGGWWCHAGKGKGER